MQQQTVQGVVMTVSSACGGLKKRLFASKSDSNSWMGYYMAKSTSNSSSSSSLNSGTVNSDKQERLAKALRANLLKRKSQSRSRSELGKDSHKEKQDG